MTHILRKIESLRRQRLAWVLWPGKPPEPRPAPGSSRFAGLQCHLPVI